MMRSVFNRARGNTKARLFAAINARRVVEFYYHGGYRTAEPFCLGVTLAGGADNESLLCYQVGGHSEYGGTVGWKLYRVSEISELEMTREKFSGDRPGYDLANPEMATIYGCIAPEKGDRARLEAKAAPAPKMAAAGIKTMPWVKDTMPLYKMPRQKAPAPLTHNELMRRFRFAHPHPLPELYTHVFA